MSRLFRFLRNEESIAKAEIRSVIIADGLNVGYTPRSDKSNISVAETKGRNCKEHVRDKKADATRNNIS